MFGYVKPFVPELKVAQYEQYRAVYCGLCRAMGEVTGQTSRLTLSYDLVFLAAVRMVLEEIEPVFEQRTCLAHPLKKRLMTEPNDALRFTAAMGAVLAYGKNADDLTDERGFSRVKPVLLHPLFASMRGKAGKRLPDACEDGIRDALARLRGLEQQNCPSADETAEIFGETLSLAFSVGLEGDKASLARRIGRSTGRFIYLCDAADDLEEDVRRKRYNPLASGWGELALEPETGRMSELVRQSVLVAAPLDLEDLGEAVMQLDARHGMTPLVQNIVYLGLPQAMKRACDGEVSPDRHRRKNSRMPGKMPEGKDYT